MSSVPDCVSTAHLMSLLDATPEDIIETRPAIDNDDPKYMIDFVVQSVDAMQETLGTTFAFKLIADYCLHQLQQIHECGYRHQLDDHNDQDIALAWARDAGHLQAMLATLKFIQCGPHDFLCPLENQDQDEE